MLINFVDATNDANHYTKPPPVLLMRLSLSKILPERTERCDLALCLFFVTSPADHDRLLEYDHGRGSRGAEEVMLALLVSTITPTKWKHFGTFSLRIANYFLKATFGGPIPT